MAKKKELTFPEIIKKLYASGLGDSKSIDAEGFQDEDKLEDIEERVRRLLGIINKPDRKITNMLFYVMYDIESNKVRYQVSKYLIKKGCFRVQRSIFLADLSSESYQQIRSDLTEVQSYYENEDSILIVPVSTELIKSMKIIGKSIDIDVITKTKSTLFF